MAAPPPFGIEATGTWATEAEEAALRDWLATDGGATVQVLGQSIDGRDIHLITLGTSGEGTFLINAGMHGNEKAGREAALQLARDLALGEVPAAGTVLDRAQIAFIPSMNPDGVEAHRQNNSDGVNPNSYNVTLDYPENRALNLAMRLLTPTLAVDLHETSGHGHEADFWLLGSTAPMAHPDIRALGDQATQAAFAALGTAGYDAQPYWSASRRAFTTLLPYYHCAGLLTEAYINHTRATRTLTQRIALDALLKHFDTHTTDLVAAQAASRQWVLDNPGPEILNFGGNAIDPAAQEWVYLAGYDTTTPVPARHIEAFDLDVNPDGFAPLAQTGRGFLPELLDPQAFAPVATATRRVSATPLPPAQPTATGRYRINIDGITTDAAMVRLGTPEGPVTVWP